MLYNLLQLSCYFWVITIVFSALKKDGVLTYQLLFHPQCSILPGQSNTAKCMHAMTFGQIIWQQNKRWIYVLKQWLVGMGTLLLTSHGVGAVNHWLQHRLKYYSATVLTTTGSTSKTASSSLAYEESLNQSQRTRFLKKTSSPGIWDTPPTCWARGCSLSPSINLDVSTTRQRLVLIKKTHGEKEFNTLSICSKVVIT